MANPKLIIEVAGDDRQLRKTLKQSETATKKWSRRMQGVSAATGTGGGLFSLGRAGGFAAAAGASLIALKKINDAARESQLILGQTSVAVENAGLSWNDYAGEVEAAANQISRASSFDDEDVLKSFSLFVRGNKNVAKSIDLAALAADVARGRYTDLESATQLVNKAAMGQVGALRRAGIQIDATATSTQALALLQEKFAGAAEEYSKSSAGAADRLRVSWENLLEDLGSNTSNQVGQTQSALAGLIDSLDRLVKKNQEVQQSWQQQVSGLEVLDQSFARTAANANAFSQAFGLGKLAPAKKAPIAFGQPGFKTVKAPPVPLGPTAEQRNQWFDSDITRRLDKTQDIATLKGQISALNEIAGLIQQRIAVTKDVTRRLSLEDQLRTVQRQKTGLAEQILANAAEAKETAKALAEQQEATRLARNQARQMRALGLSAAGEQIVPGADNLRKQLAQLSSRQDIGELPNKLASALEGARKVLAGKWGEVKEDSRSAIQDLFATIRGELNKGSGNLTRTTSLNSNAILSGLGLDRNTQRLLTARLSTFNSAGTANAGAAANAINLTIAIDGRPVEASVTRNQQKRARANPPKRRGS